MAMPRQVSRKLREMLGEDDGGAMSEWLDNLDSKSDDLRQDVWADMAELRQEVHAVREEMRVGMAGLREEMRVGFATARSETSKEITSFLKWAIGVWITSFALIVGALSFLQRTR